MTDLEVHLREAEKGGKSLSLVVREALSAYFANREPEPSAYDAFVKLGLLGCAQSLPPDLSTNRKYFKGFGKSR